MRFDYIYFSICIFGSTLDSPLRFKNLNEPHFLWGSLNFKPQA
jgi:hypothetical protein